MNKNSDKFISEKDHAEFDAYMDDALSLYSLPVKKAFVTLFNILSSKPDVVFDFKLRPGVSASFKTYIGKKETPDSRLFSVIDIIDQDLQNIWLSVCFYADMITDPGDLGNLIPGGLLEDDGYCFDVFEEDNMLMKYLEIRINEAYGKVVQGEKLRCCSENSGY
jgi:hypothetical protein